MSKDALVVMSESGEAHPGGQGRMLHALQAAAEFRSAGVEVSMWFHGIGVEWLTVFEARSDRFGRSTVPVRLTPRCRRGRVRVLHHEALQRGGQCEGARGSRGRGANEHHTVAHLVADGYQVIVF